MYVTSSVPSQAQVFKLLKFLESNKWLTTSQARTSAARDRSRAAWQFITARLNNTGGCKKSWQQWSKYWKDKKSVVKKKALATQFSSEIELSHIEQRIYAIIQIEMAGKCKTASSLKTESGSKNVYKILKTDDDVMDTEKKHVVFNQHLLADEEIINEYDANSRLLEDTDRNSSPEQDPLPNTSEHTHAEDEDENGSPTPPRSKTRLRMEELTERFLKIEESRVEIELKEAKTREKLAESLEQMSQAWRQQSEAFLSIAESIKNMVGKLNKS